jgi:hypothetical protein
MARVKCSDYPVCQKYMVCARQSPILALPVIKVQRPETPSGSDRIKRGADTPFPTEDWISKQRTHEQCSEGRRCHCQSWSRGRIPDHSTGTCSDSITKWFHRKPHHSRTDGASIECFIVRHGRMSVPISEQDKTFLLTLAQIW